MGVWLDNRVDVRLNTTRQLNPGSFRGTQFTYAIRPIGITVQSVDKGSEAIEVQIVRPHYVRFERIQHNGKPLFSSAHRKESILRGVGSTVYCFPVGEINEALASINEHGIFVQKQSVDEKGKIPNCELDLFLPKHWVAVKAENEKSQASALEPFFSSSKAFLEQLTSYKDLRVAEYSLLMEEYLSVSELLHQIYNLMNSWFEHRGVNDRHQASVLKELETELKQKKALLADLLHKSSKNSQFSKCDEERKNLIESMESTLPKRVVKEILKNANVQD